MNFDEVRFQLAKVQHVCHQIILLPTILLLHVKQCFFFFQKSLIATLGSRQQQGYGLVRNPVDL